MSIPLAALEDIIDACGVAPTVEALLPVGVRPRQLKVRTLILGMLLTQASRQPAHLTRVHEALTSLPTDDQARLNVTENCKHGPHQLTYRQVERTFRLVAIALGKHNPHGAPSDILARTCDDLLEASIPTEHNHTTRALAVDWTRAENVRPKREHGTWSNVKTSGWS